MSDDDFSPATAAGEVAQAGGGTGFRVNDAGTDPGGGPGAGPTPGGPTTDQATDLCHWHATADPTEGVCCLCESEDGLGCRVMARIGNEARRQVHAMREAALPPTTPDDPWVTDDRYHVDDKDLDGRGMRSAFGV